MAASSIKRAASSISVTWLAPVAQPGTAVAAVMATPTTGAFVAVDDRYSGLIPRKDFHGGAQIGDVIEARVTAVHEDGKLDLSMREKAYLQMDKDAETVLKVIDEFDGVLPFNDKASPEVIERELKLSKNAFKRAVGRLLKEGKIEITPKSIRRRS